MIESNAPNITDWIQAIGTGISALASLVLLIGIFLAARQIKEATKWNKLNATFTYFDPNTFASRDRSVTEALATIGINFYELSDPLNAAQVDAIYFNNNIFKEVRDYLDLLEDYATAVNVGALDEDCAYAKDSLYITQEGRFFQPFIERARAAIEEEDFYIELEKLVLRWSERHEREKLKNKQEIEQLKKRLQESRGVKPKK